MRIPELLASLPPAPQEGPVFLVNTMHGVHVGPFTTRGDADLARQMSGLSGWLVVTKAGFDQWTRSRESARTREPRDRRRDPHEQSLGLRARNAPVRLARRPRNRGRRSMKRRIAILAGALVAGWLLGVIGLFAALLLGKFEEPEL